MTARKKTRRAKTSKSRATSEQKKPGKSEKTPAAGGGEPDPAGAPVEPVLSFPVVGLGASAGGLEVFKQFFAVLPADTGMAFVIVQHMAPSDESLMPRILAKHTEMQVLEARNGMPIAPDTVYVIPPNTTLTLDGPTLKTQTPIEVRGLRKPIDLFFESLADTQRHKAIAVVLSGTGSDGALGLKSVKAYGGMTAAQEPATAEYDGMPRMAIATGAVDLVLGVESIPDALIRYSHHRYVRAQAAPHVANDLTHFEAILTTLHTRANFDFRPYKKATLSRRIQRRMGLLSIDDLGKYAELLYRDRSELKQLREDLLINVTGFFREPDSFEVLRQQIFPKLFETENGTLRVWVPACSTGEEAYSLAMLLHEERERGNHQTDFQIFATDVDSAALDVGRAGVYPEASGAAITPERLERFFTMDDGALQVRRELRDHLIFAPQNVLADPPLSQLHLISCRNLMIYIESIYQTRLFSLFHFALRSNGVLILGRNETIGSAADLFTPISPEWRVYQRIGPRRNDLSFPIQKGGEAGARKRPAPEPAHPSHAEVARRAIADHFGPAAALIRSDFSILYLRGGISRFLDVPEGEPSLNLLDLLPAELRGRARAAASKADRVQEPVVLESVRFTRNELTITARLRVIPMADQQALFCIEEATHTVAPTEEAFAQDAFVVQQLEDELRQTRDELQSAIEELETSNEEMRASNEEAMSTNEELQSANQELESSRAELQSLNEELIAVNAELEDKVHELEGTSNDLTSLLKSTNIGTLFLDRDLRVRRYTAAVTGLFHLIPSDLGRPITDVASNFIDGDLAEQARTVLRTLAPYEAHVESQGSWYTKQILPYRTEDDRIAGVVVTFTDVSELRSAQEELMQTNRHLESEVVERTRLFRLVHEVAAHVNGCDDTDDMLRGTLRYLCDFGGWSTGHFYNFDERSGTLLPSNHWYPPSDGAFGSLRRSTAGLRFAPGEGNVGRAYQSNEPLFVLNRAGQTPDIRAGATQCEIQSGLFVPVTVEGTAFGVVELFARTPIQPAKPLLSATSDAAHILGQGLSRRRTESLASRMEASEHERIALLLHDSVGQRISGAAMVAHALKRKLGESLPAGRPTFDELSSNIEEAKLELGGIIRSLMPVAPGSDGLIGALERLSSESDGDTMSCSFECELVDGIDDSFTSRHLYYIAQEAVTNARRHANARSVTISLRRDAGRILLEVSDDGTGMGKRHTGSGVRIMRYRAALLGAQLKLQSSPGEGTVVSCELPLEQKLRAPS